MSVGDLDHQCAVVKRRNKDLIIKYTRHRDGDLRPLQLAFSKIRRLLQKIVGICEDNPNLEWRE